MSAPSVARRPEFRSLSCVVDARPLAELAALALVVAVWAVLTLLIDPLGNFPLNDDWVYGLAVRSILQTGHFALPSPSSANLLLQAYWGALFCLPFGFSFTALRVSTMVLGAIGLGALYLLLRELGAARRIAVAGALTLAVNPLYLGLAASFMTDVPFTSLVTAALLLYVRGVKRANAVLVGLAFLLAFGAIFIRQFGLVLPLAFGVAHLVRKGTSGRTLAAALLPVLLGVALQLLYEHWLIATGRTPVVPVPLGGLLSGSPLLFAERAALAILVALPNLGLGVAPFLACFAFTRRGRPLIGLPRPGTSWQVQALLCALLTLGLVASGAPLPALGDVLVPSGLGPLTLRDTWVLRIHEPRIPGLVTALWLAMTVVSAWAAIALVLAIAEMVAGAVRNFKVPEWRSTAWPQVLLLAVLGSYAAGLLLVSGSSSIFDRYFVPLIPIALALLLIDRGHREPMPDRTRDLLPGAIFIALYAAFAVTATHDYLAWNRARWRATDSLMQSGVTPHHIDGGYEFDGWYLYRPNYQVKPGKSYWWVDDDEYVIASGPLSGYHEVAQFRVNRWLALTESQVLVLRRAGARSKSLLF